LNYVLIRREIEPNVFVEALSADLQAAWRQPKGSEDLGLQPRDTVYVFNLDIGRQYIVGPLIDELRAQAPQNEPVRVVRVGGQVRAPGDYPLESGMTIADLIRAGGGLTEAAYGIDAELTRYEIINGEYRETELVTVDLTGVLAGNIGASLALSPYDILVIKELPRWRGQQTVELIGEVVFPGIYPLRQGEALSSVLTRAGGVTDLAFAEGSLFLREDLKQREREQLEILAVRLEGDLAAIALSETGSDEALSVGQSLIAQLRDAQPVGRLVIDLSQILTGDSIRDIVLEDGDTLFVPGISQEVTVLGEVQSATSHVYQGGLGRDDYIELSGGFTARADEKRIYVVRANGAVIASTGSRWFARARTGDIRPGDTVVVPLDTSTGQRLAVWTSVTQIIYQLAIAAAAVQSF